LEGLITIHGIKEISRESWATVRVEDVNQFPVIDDGRFAGIVSRGSGSSFLRGGADLERESVHHRESVAGGEGMYRSSGNVVGRRKKEAEAESSLSRRMASRC
jgi:hypothetical protein